MNEGLIERGHGEATDEWETPPWLFQALHSEFAFNFDAAASQANHLCPRWSAAIQHDVLDPSIRAFCNPPYSNIDLFVDKALTFENGLWVFVLPAFVDKLWYRRLYESPRVDWRPFAKRIRFWLNGKPGGSPFFGTTLAIVTP